MRRWWWLVGLAGALGLGGCEACDGDDDDFVETDGDADSDADGDSDAGVPPGLGVGDPCEADRDCRTGLECDDVGQTCQPVPDGEVGEPCGLSAECVDGLYCGPTGTCEPAGTTEAGEACGSPADCAPGLFCDIRGLGGGTCTPGGTADWGDDCASTADCLPGLFCGQDDTCAPFPHAFPPWQGVECPPDSEESVAYFEVPRGGQDAHDFFRLPYPNDARIVDGHPDLSGIPTPGAGVLGVDVVALYKDAIQRDMTAFGTNSPVFFRFSQGIDPDTLDGASDTPTFDVVDITADSPGYAGPRGWRWSYNHATRYACPHWLAIGPSVGQAYAPETTYAVWLTTDVRDEQGGTIARDPDFDAMMSDDVPADADLAAAHARYQVLRDYLDEQGIARSSILVASVFTTGAVRDPASRIREAVRAAGDPPAPQDLMACQDGTVSICVDGGDPVVRDCGAESDAFFELHGRFDDPQIQSGTLPYELDGGEVEVDGDGLPIVQGSQPVCFSLSIPRGTAMPAEGWPVVIFSHGTGGNFRNAMREGIAGALSAVETADGETVHFAVLGYDGVMHGDRRGGSERGEDELFFNVLNPHAARDNMLQGAADLFQIVRLVESFDLDPGASPIAESIRFDPTKIYFFGHSQGSNVGALFAPFEPDVSVAVFSGAGAHLVSSLLHKTSPVDATLGIALILGEVPDSLGRTGIDHPILNLFQAYFERSDAINYNRLLAYESIDGGTNFLQTYGLGDTYSPVDTLKAFARSAVAATVRPVLDPTGSGAPDVDPPVAGNLRRPEGNFTAALIQYEPAEGDDGHFVAFDDAEANARVMQFFATAALSDTGTPTVVP